MTNIFNREDEQSFIDDAFNALHNYKDDLLRTPIVDFYGVEGIGKTAMLKHVEQKCKEQKIPYILIDTWQGAKQFSREIIRQVQRYNIQLSTQDGDVFQLSQQATKKLLAKGTAVMLFDAVDATDKELLERIAELLREVINDNKLFVVITSRRSLLFETERSVARKLTTYRLKPFDRKTCEVYASNFSTELGPEVIQCIFDWTQGYPLAIQVMMQAIIDDKLDPREPEDQRLLVDIIIKRVIHKGILADLKPPFFQECLTALELFSIPRRFNLVIIQELIEHFAVAELRQESSLSYMDLPRSINQNTDALTWDMLRAGFSVIAPVRAIFLLKSRIEQPERYILLHRFLANLNKQFADAVSGTDRIRYFREYLYHSALTEDAQGLSEIIDQTVQRIVSEPAQSFEQFYEEFLQDKELQESLGKQSDHVLSLLYKHRALVNRQAARKASEVEHFRHLQNYFYHVILDPEVSDLRTVLAESIRDVLTEEPAGSETYIVKELLRDEKFKVRLGKHLDLFIELLQENV